MNDFRIVNSRLKTSALLSYVATGGASGKEPTASAEDGRDTGSIPGLEIYPRGGHGNPLQYSCLENLMDRGA